MSTLISRIGFILLMQVLTSSLFAHVVLDYPTGGETLVTGSTVMIQWHIAIPHNTLNWDVLFSADGGATWEFIQMDLPAGTLSYQWVVPSTLTMQARVSVIQDNDGTDYQDESMNFTIEAPPMLPILVVEAMNITIESNVSTQDDNIQAWLDNHGGMVVTSFCNNLNWTNDYAGLTYTCGNSGNAVVTFTATDLCGSTESVATITVSDTTPPVLNQPASPMTVECDGQGNTTQLNAWLSTQGGAMASDAGGTVNWFTDEHWSEIVCGSTGILFMTFLSVDECFNFTSTQSTFTIEDHTIPEIQLSAMDTTIECGLPNTATILQNWLNRNGGAIANEVCGGVVWTNSFSAIPDTCKGSNSLTVIFTATDNCGNRDSTSAILTLLGTSRSTFPVQEEARFTLSPNPVSQTLQITFDQQELINMNITLINAYGNPILTMEGVSGEVVIPVYDFAPGVYVVQAKTSNGVSTRKVIIE